MKQLPIEGRYGAAFQSWRDSALRAISADWPADGIQWCYEPLTPGTQGLMDFPPDNLIVSPERIDRSHSADDVAYVPLAQNDLAELRAFVPAPLRVTKALAELMREAALFRDPQRWQFLYHVLRRWAHGDRTCASAADSDGGRLHRMVKAVRRDKHDMIAYVRFRQSGDGVASPEYVADYAPEHDVLEWAADHFAERMGKASWLISTPDAVAMSDGLDVTILPKSGQFPPLLHESVHPRRGEDTDRENATVPANQVAPRLPRDDKHDAEALWLIYYRSIFNPARVNQRGLEQHMPVRFWRGLPEAALIPSMLSAAHTGNRKVGQVQMVGAKHGKTVVIAPAQAQPRRDPASTLDQCRRCALWKSATQVVPGCGPTTARIMLIGEQPGDQEDLAGQPFVGPAGKLLDRALHEAGLTRDRVYLTNAVKHFKWTRSGKRRLHKTPQQREIEACRTWLEDELDSVRPDVIVTLGATALRSLFGAGGTPSEHGRQAVHATVTGLRASGTAPLLYRDTPVLATRHPAYALRQVDDGARVAIFDEIVDTLRLAEQRSAALR